MILPITLTIAGAAALINIWLMIRVGQVRTSEEVSVGDFVLNGGEVAAMVIVDAVVRLLPGVLGDENSNLDDSFSRGNRLLEFPQYTRPREFRGHSVPEVLLGGDHQAIARRVARWMAPSLGWDESMINEELDRYENNVSGSTVVCQPVAAVLEG